MADDSNPIRNDPHFIHAPRYGNDIRALLKAHPDGCSDAAIAKALAVSETRLEAWWKTIAEKLRAKLVEEP